MRKIKYPLIVSDFDGTLASSNGNLSEKNKSAIKEFCSQGGKFAISTGRMPSGILPRTRELGLQGVVCCGQGSALVEIDSGKVISFGGIDNATAVKVCEKMQEMHLHTHVYGLWNYYCNMDDKWLKDYENIVRTKAELVLDIPISEFVKEKGLNPCKILAIVNPSEALSIMEEFRKENFENCEITRSADFLVEICSNRYSKGTSVSFLAKRYDIPLENVIAVGDQYNDLSMLETAGLGVAVKNADEVLKKSANLVLDYTNDEDAIAHLIEEYAYWEE